MPIIGGDQPSAPGKGSSTACQAKIDALVSCKKKHKGFADVVCQSLERAVGWCVFAQVCPAEVEMLEACAPPERRGMASASSASSRGPHDAIARAPGGARCREAADRLEACLEGHTWRAAEAFGSGGAQSPAAP